MASFVVSALWEVKKDRDVLLYWRMDAMQMLSLDILAEFSSHCFYLSFWTCLMGNLMSDCSIGIMKITTKE
jgi:hypothetical protein